MPVYEFYCADCHTLFDFFSGSVDTEKRPDCPRCGRKGLERQLSAFAAPRSGGADDEGGGGPGGFDENRVDRAITELTREAGSMNEEDPRQAVQLMRRLTEAVGMNVGEGMQEAMRRIEAGEDPEEVEAALGETLDGEDPLALEAAAGRRRGPKTRPPRKDETLHRL